MAKRWSADEYVRALRFAARAHGSQSMKDDGAPYIVHPVTVALEVIAAFRVESGLDEDLAVKCALLHDVLEDTGVGEKVLAREFGRSVAAGVRALSKDPRVAKEEQLRDSLRRIRRARREIWMVKLADRIANLAPPPKAWSKPKRSKYRDDAIEILATLRDGSAFLAKRLEAKIEAYAAFL